MSCRAVIGRHRDRGLPQRAPGLSRCTCAAIAACPPLVKSPRAHRLWVSFIDGSGSESRLDIFAVNVRLIYELLRRGVWTIPLSFPSTGRGRRFTTPRPCCRRGPGNTIPSISPIRAQARGRFAQVIHRVVHSKAARSSPVRLAGSRAPVRRCLRCATGTRTPVPGLSPDQIAEEGGWLDAHHTLQDRRAASLSRPPDRQLILIRCGPRVFDTLKLPRPLVTPRRHHNRESKREAQGPPRGPVQQLTSRPATAHPRATTRRGLGRSRRRPLTAGAGRQEPMASAG